MNEFYSRETQWRGVWSVFDGIIAENELVAAFKLKIILLRADYFTEVLN